MARRYLVSTTLVLVAACAVPHPGVRRSEAHKYNGTAIGVGALLAIPAAGAAVFCRDCGGPGPGLPLILGSALLVSGVIGVIATASGVTCPVKKSIWTCADP